MATRTALARLTRLSATTTSSAARHIPTPFHSTALRLQAQQQSWRRSFSASVASLEKRYSEDHEWVELDTDGTTASIGISTYAAKALGDVVYVELPAIDADITKGDTIGAVESVKSASDILAPASGKVLETNKMLEEKPGAINKSPESEAWIAKIKISNQSELESLMDKDAYKKFTAEDM